MTQTAKIGIVEAQKREAQDAGRHKAPRLVITGVNQPSQPNSPKPTEYSLDWLQYSIPWPLNLLSWPTTPQGVQAILLNVLPRHEALYSTGEFIEPLRNYSAGHRMSHGRVFWHEKRRDQKIGVLFSGEELSSARADKVDELNLIRFALDTSTKIARLDFALDIFVDGAHPLEMYDAWKGGAVDTGAGKVSPWTSGTKDAEGEVTETSTVYFGAEKSDRRMRVYDKAAERGTTYPWIRIELVSRDERAWSLAETMRKHGIATAGRSAIADFVWCEDLAWWRAALEGDVVAMEPVKRKHTNTEKWLLQQVLPVLSRIIDEQQKRGEWEIYDAYQATLDRHMRGRNGNRRK